MEAEKFFKLSAAYSAQDARAQRAPHINVLLRSISIEQSLAYPPRLAVDLGSYVDGEAHGWARQPYGYFDPAPRPRDIIHTYSYVPTAPSGAPHERVKAR